MVIAGALLLLAVYSIGKRIGSRNSETRIIENYGFVRTIAQLSTLESNGNATITTTNASKDGGVLGTLSNLLGEKTATVTVPYQAKYGVDLEKKEFRIERRDTLIIVHLPQPQLLSYELRLDRMIATNRKGWFIPQNDNFYTDIQKRLYEKSRADMANNHQLIEASKSKLDSVLRAYYAPVGLHVVTEYGSSGMHFGAPD